MRKFLLLAACIAVFAFSEETDLRSKFLFSYYDGDYEGAHRLLPNVFHDPTVMQTWEERIHFHKKINGCDYEKRSTPGIRGVSRVRIGEFDEARSLFADDWPSLLGQATLAVWKNDWAGARDSVDRALKLNPDNPELVYFAANVTDSTEKSIEYFTKFLSLSPEDPLKKTSAEFSIDFNKKTLGLELNSTSIESNPESIETQFQDGRLLIRGTIDQKRKVHLLLDTGAGSLTVAGTEWQPRINSPVVMTGIGKTNSSKANHGVFDLFESGKFTTKNPVIAVLPSLPGSGFEGIIGTILFSNYYALIPLKSGKDVMLFLPGEMDPLKFLDSKGIHFESSVTLPFYMVNKMIIVKGRIKKSPETMDFLIDTGAQQSILSIAAAKQYARINPDSYRARQSIVGAGGRDQALVAENVEIEMGPLKNNFNRIAALNLTDVCETLELELDMILGRDFLNGYTLLLDYKGNRITFLK